MRKAKSQKTVPRSTAAEQPPPAVERFRSRLSEEAKRFLAKWMVRVGFALAATITGLLAVLSFVIPGAYVAPDGVNWTFQVAEDPPVIAANARVPEWFGLHYRNIPSFEWNARDAVNAYLAKHKPNCRIFSLSPSSEDALVPCESKVMAEGRNCSLQMPGGEKATLSAWWGTALVCE